MAIKRFQNRGRVPRLGKIHLGEKARNAQGVEYPRATDHFVLPDELRAIFGPKCTDLPIMLAHEDIDNAASLFYRAYGRATGLVCRGDGETAVAILDAAKYKGVVEAGIWATHETKPENVIHTEIPCAGEGDERAGIPPCPHYAAKNCRRLMMLRFIVRGSRHIGVYQIDTGSYNSQLNILGFLEMLQGAMSGRIAGLNLVLRLVPQEVNADGRKKTVHVLQLTADTSQGGVEAFLKLANMSVREAIEAGNALALPEGRGPEVLEGEVEPVDENSAGEFFGDASDLPDAPSDEALAEEADANASPDAPRDAVADEGELSPPLPPPTSARPRPTLKGGEDKADPRKPTMACEHVAQLYVEQRWKDYERSGKNKDDLRMCGCCTGPIEAGEFCRQCQPKLV